MFRELVKEAVGAYEPKTTNKLIIENYDNTVVDKTEISKACTNYIEELLHGANPDPKCFGAIDFFVVVQAISEMKRWKPSSPDTHTMKIYQHQEQTIDKSIVHIQE